MGLGMSMLDTPEAKNFDFLADLIGEAWEAAKAGLGERKTDGLYIASASPLEDSVTIPIAAILVTGRHVAQVAAFAESLVPTEAMQERAILLGDGTERTEP